MLPSEQQWSAFHAQMKLRTGLDLTQYKANQIQRRILGMMSTKKATTLEEFWAWIASDQANITWFMDKLAINVSELYRNPEKWVELEQKVIPELLTRSQSLKIWSAGCSYGAEAHTMALLLHTKFPGAHKVIGSDIDQAALAQAKLGQFSDADMRSVPPDQKRDFFDKRDGHWYASDQIRKYVSFVTKDLLTKNFDTGFDLIMCRNVVIYFTEDAKDALYVRFYEALKPGGYLFVGSTERVTKSREIGFASVFPFFYQKPIMGESIWRNAS